MKMNVTILADGCGTDEERRLVEKAKADGVHVERVEGNRFLIDYNRKPFRG